MCLESEGGGSNSKLDSAHYDYSYSIRPIIWIWKYNLLQFFKRAPGKQNGDSNILLAVTIPYFDIIEKPINRLNDTKVNKH